jgi:hypothetical protein
VLVEHGADVDATDHRLRTALAMAAAAGFSHVVTRLAEKGGNVSAHDAEGFTPLHWAASMGHVRTLTHTLFPTHNSRPYPHIHLLAPPAWHLGTVSREPALHRGKHVVFQRFDGSFADGITPPCGMRTGQRRTREAPVPLTFSPVQWAGAALVTSSDTSVLISSTRGIGGVCMNRWGWWVGATAAGDSTSAGAAGGAAGAAGQRPCDAAAQRGGQGPREGAQVPQGARLQPVRPHRLRTQRAAHGGGIRPACLRTSCPITQLHSNGSDNWITVAPNIVHAVVGRAAAKRPLTHAELTDGRGFWCWQVRALVEMGIASHTRDERGRQAIHDAARSGHVDTVRTLVSLKASVEAQDDAGNTPLHLAAGYGKVATVQTLVRELKADVDLGNDQGERALHLAAATGQVCDCVCESVRVCECV